MQSPKIKFVILFVIVAILLNLILFAPAQLIRLDPLSIINDLTIYESIFYRETFDLWRISGETLIIICIILILPFVHGGRMVALILLTVIFSSLFIYEIYYHTMVRIYFDHPNLMGDWALLFEIVPVFLSEIGFSFEGILATVFTFGLCIGFYFVLIFLYRIARNIQPRIRIALTISLLFATSIFSHNSSYLVNHLQGGEPGFGTIAWIHKDILRSLEKPTYSAVDSSFSSEGLLKNFTNVPAWTPNIYLIFVESYGSVINYLEAEAPQYEVLVDSLDTILKGSGWHTASANSIAPIVGGRSWLSFTSFISGLKISNHLQYNDLLENHYRFPHLIRWFNYHGYYTHRMKTFIEQGDPVVSYELIDRYFSFDQWIRYKDFNYQGNRYDWFGGIPDQYAINFFQDEIADRSPSPYLLFFITMNTHGPWFNPAPLVNDWRSLDTINPGGTIRTQDGSEHSRYFQTIKYDLEVFTKFIIERLSDDDVMILIGDHQPAFLDRFAESMNETHAVPAHVISKNSEFTDVLESFGFVTGWDLSEDQPVNIAHENFYDILTQSLSLTKFHH